ncbi:MAG: hypothetical protein AAGE96_17465, partial [Cyanobacteria bacterium P01_G01_bin.19]
GLGVSFDDLIIFNSEEGATVNALGQDLAILQDVTAAELEETSFAGLEVSTLAIAEEFIELYDAAFTNPTTEFDNLAALLAEDAVFSFPQEQLLFPETEISELVGDEQIQDYFLNTLTLIVPNETEVFEFLPDDGSYALSDENNKVAVRLKESGIGTETGEEFEQSATWLIEIDEEGLVEQVEFYSNSYPGHAAVLGLGSPTEIPENDPFTFQEVEVDRFADSQTAIEVATTVWESAAVGELITNADLIATDTIWSFAIGGPSNNLPYVGTAEGLTSDGQPLEPDLSNLGPIFTDILGPLGAVVQAGDLEIVETFAHGDRVLVHLVEGQEQLPVAIGTGTEYERPLDLLSWLSVEDGQVVSNEVIVNTLATVNALGIVDEFIV